MLVGCVPKAKYVELEDQVEECRQELRAAKAPPPKERDRVHEDLLTDLRPLVDKGVLEVERRGGRTTVAMRAEVLFASGSADLSEGGRETVREVGRALARQADARWQVEGHTDGDPIQSEAFPSNWHLGAARAITVVEELVKAGMPPKSVSAATFASYAPVASNDKEQGKAENRRIEIVLLPQGPDGQHAPGPGRDRPPKPPPRKPPPRPR
jgi:chemotaxis protein MotB